MRLRFYYLFLFILLSTNILAGNETSKFETLVENIEKNCFSNGSKSILLVDSLYQYTNNEPNNSYFKIYYWYCKMLVYYSQGINAADLITEINNSPYYASKQVPAIEQAILKYTLALGYMSKDDYAQAFTFALQSLDEFEKKGNTKFTINNLLLLESICGFIKNPTMAKEYYNQIASIVTPEQPEYYKMHIMWYNSLYSSQQYDAAIDSLTDFLPVLKKYDDKGLLAMAYANLSTFYITKNEADSAYDYLEILQETIHKIDNMQITCIFYQNMGIYYLSQRDFKKAEEYLRTYMRLANESENSSYLYYSAYTLYMLFEERKNVDSAFFYLKQSFDLRESLIANSKIVEEYQTYVSMLLASSEQEIIIKEQQILLEQRRLSAVVILAIGIILLIVSSLIILYQQKRNVNQQNLLKEAENKELEKQLHNEQQIQNLQNERIESQIREITSISLLLSGKNNILQQIETAAQQLPQNIVATNTIRQIIKNNLNTDKSWDDFVLHFDKVHPSFFERLKSYKINLSENDLHLFAYFRIGMSTKQIAQILNITPEAVRMHRYRLKKKFGLREEEDFNDFIRNI